MDPDGGCACEKEECPTGDEQLKCSDEKCKGGDDKKCSVNPYTDCECIVECPTGDEQLVCSDEKCKGGGDKKCTVEPNKDCDCKVEDEECPTGLATLRDEQCGGVSEDGLCKGVSRNR